MPKAYQPVMLILKGVRSQLDGLPAIEYAGRRGYEGRILDASGETGPGSDQVTKALRAFRADPLITAIYGFSGGGYNVLHILNALTPAERARLTLIVVLGAPPVGEHRQPTKAAFEGDWELVYRLDPPAGHMAGPRALLAELSSEA